MKPQIVKWASPRGVDRRFARPGATWRYWPLTQADVECSERFWRKSDRLVPVRGRITGRQYANYMKSHPLPPPVKVVPSSAIQEAAERLTQLPLRVAVRLARRLLKREPTVKYAKAFIEWLVINQPKFDKLSGRFYRHG